MTTDSWIVQAIKSGMKSGQGRGNWGHAGRPGLVGGSASGSSASGHVGNYVDRTEGRQDRRVGSDSGRFISKTVAPLGKSDEQFVLHSNGGRGLREMEQGPEGYANSQGINIAAAKRRILWARDAGLVEKTKDGHRLTPLGEKIAAEGVSKYRDHLDMMTGNDKWDHSPTSEAVGHWIYANWPGNTSRVRFGELEHEFNKVTNYKTRRLEVYLSKLEQDHHLAYERIADLDQVGLAPRGNREDFF